MTTIPVDPSVLAILADTDLQRFDNLTLGIPWTEPGSLQELERDFPDMTPTERTAFQNFIEIMDGSGRSRGEAK